MTRPLNLSLCRRKKKRQKRQVSTNTSFACAEPKSDQAERGKRGKRGSDPILFFFLLPRLFSTLTPQRSQKERKEARTKAKRIVSHRTTPEATPTKSDTPAASSSAPPSETEVAHSNAVPSPASLSPSDPSSSESDSHTSESSAGVDADTEGSVTSSSEEDLATGDKATQEKWVAVKGQPANSDPDS
jgi:hypothetical protein